MSYTGKILKIKIHRIALEINLGWFGKIRRYKKIQFSWSSNGLEYWKRELNLLKSTGKIISWDIEIIDPLETQQES